jgi:matrix metalloproteinase-14 (membrane-inserted)
MYLSQFGWLDPSTKKMGTPGTEALIDLRKSISDFQSFAGLNVTGELDPETVELMGMPRCGVRDKVGHDARRRKRYALQGKL